MEVAIPKNIHLQDFNFPSAAVTSPYSAVPPSPTPFGHYFFSAPASPYRDFDGGDDNLRPPPSAEPDDFAFDFSEDLERASLSADELFDGGKIKPSIVSSTPAEQQVVTAATEVERGRERSSRSVSGGGGGRRAARSLSPIRSSASEPTPPTQTQAPPQRQEKPQPTSFSSAPKPVTKSSSSKKWRLRDFLLFRSASEGRASDKDPLRSRYYHGKKLDESEKGGGSLGSGHRRRSGGGGGGPAEVHYTANKAVSEDLKKKTFLPYKQGILGRLAFNPAVHALANGFGSISRA